jgi:aspartate carbamoyltransferase
MQGFYRSHVLSTMGWTSEKLTPLLDLAAAYKDRLARREVFRLSAPHTLITLFYEPSTRTRLSFESAAHRLGIRILTVADAVHDSSSWKGETLEDMGRIISAYADVVVIRHPELGSAGRFASGSSIPVINAGDGPGEHPTQSLVDLFTIREAFGSLKGLRVGLCGDLRYGRTIHSLLRLLLDFQCQVVAISPEELAIPPEILAKLPAAGSLRQERQLQSAIGQIDVLYMTRVQKERFKDLESYDRVRDVFRLTGEDLKGASDHLRVLHPLPRVNEIAPEVDADSRALYFAQSANGVPVRMALLSAILGVERSLMAEDLFSSASADLR